MIIIISVKLLYVNFRVVSDSVLYCPPLANIKQRSCKQMDWRQVQLNFLHS